MSTTHKGTCKWFNANKGFGFIVPEAGGNDVFIHISALAGRPLTEGQKVSYELGEDRNGRMNAVNVMAA